MKGFSVRHSNKYLVLISLVFISCDKTETQLEMYQRFYTECLGMERQSTRDAGFNPDDDIFKPRIETDCQIEARKRAKRESGATE